MPVAVDAYFQKEKIKVEAFGIGDAAMAGEGFENLARAEDMAVVGITEVISHWSVIKKAYYDLLQAVQTRARLLQRAQHRRSSRLRREVAGSLWTGFDKSEHDRNLVLSVVGVKQSL